MQGYNTIELCVMDHATNTRGSNLPLLMRPQGCHLLSNKYMKIVKVLLKIGQLTILANPLYLGIKWVWMQNYTFMHPPMNTHSKSILSLLCLSILVKSVFLVIFLACRMHVVKIGATRIKPIILLFEYSFLLHSSILFKYFIVHPHFSLLVYFSKF